MPRKKNQRNPPQGHYTYTPHDLSVTIPGSIPMDPQLVCNFRAFMQGMANRRAVGLVRYKPHTDARQKYMTRLGKEFKAYKKTGNAEHLLNIAVYAYLESEAPEHKNQHWDILADSATRDEFGGGVE